jgi:hypothetical protein
VSNGEKRRNFVGQSFWALAYSVPPVGRDEAVIGTYIRNQEQEDQRLSCSTSAFGVSTGERRAVSCASGRRERRSHRVARPLPCNATAWKYAFSGKPVVDGDRLNISRPHEPTVSMCVNLQMAEQSPNSAETPAALRAQAERIRVHARNFGNPEVVERLEEYAAELDARANALEQGSRPSER